MKSRNGIIRIVLFIILLYLLCLYFSVGYSKIDPSLIGQVLLLSLIGFILYIFKEEKYVLLKNQYLTISAVFLVSFIPTCFQYYYLYYANIVTDLSLGYYLNTNVVNRSVILSSIGLISFFIGSLHSFKQRHNVISFSESEDVSLNNKGLQIGAVLLFLIYFAAMPKDYFLGNYGNTDFDTKIAGIPRFAQQFYNYFVIASVAAVSFKIWSKRLQVSFWGYVKHFRKSFVITLALNSILIITSGDRDNLIYTLGVFLIAFILIKGIKFTLKRVVFLGIPAVLVFFIWGLWREVDFDVSTSDKIAIVKDMSDNMDMAVYFAATDEFARVVRAQHAIIMYVQESGHQLLTLLYEFVGLVPGMGMVFTTLLGIEQSEIVSSYVATAYMRSDHGMGTTCIADLYLSLGVFGVCLFLYFLGYMYRKIEITVYYDRRKLNYWIFYLTIFVYAVLIGRADMMTPFRHCFYVFIFVYLFNTGYFNKMNKLKNTPKV